VTWFKVDDKFHASEEVMSIPLSQRAAAIGLWTLSGAWSSDHLKNGYVPLTHLETWGGTVEMADALVTAKLWIRVGKRGYQFRNWEKWQITREQVELNRERERDKKAEWRAAKAAKSGVGPDGVPGGHLPRPQLVPSIPTRPDPTRPLEEAKASSSARATALPASWAPTAEHFEKAKQLGVDVVREAEAFRLHADTHDRRAVRWNSAFTSWLMKAKPSTGLRKVSPADEWMYR